MRRVWHRLVMPLKLTASVPSMWRSGLLLMNQPPPSRSVLPPATPPPPSPRVSPAVAGISLAATLVESLPVNQSIDDNLSVPGVAAFLGIMFLQVGLLHSCSLHPCVMAG